MVDDDDSDESPSSEPQTDSRSALPREIRAWRRLCIVKRDETFSLIFFLHETKYIELELRSVEHQGAHETGRRAQGEGVRPPPSWTGCGPPGVDSFASIFYYFQNILCEVSGHSENFYFCTKQHHGNSAENILSQG